MTACQPDNPFRSVEHVVKLLRPSLKIPPDWLPLPQALAASLPWDIDFFGSRQPLPLVDLADPGVVQKLSTEQQCYCWFVLDFALRKILRRNALPPQLLEVRLCPNLPENHRLNGVLKGIGITRKTRLGDALRSIGASPAKLLRALENAGHLQPVTTRIRLRLRVPDKVLSDASAAAQVGKPYRRTGNLSRRVRKSGPEVWATKRMQFSADVRIPDGRGAVVTAQDPRFGEHVIRAVALQAQGEGQFHERLLADIEAARNLTLPEELVAIAAALCPDRKDKKRSVRPPHETIGRLFGVDGQDITPAELAREFNITGSAVGSIRNKFIACAKQGTLYAPILSWASEALAGGHDGTEAEIRERLGPRLGRMSVVGAVELIKALGPVQADWASLRAGQVLTAAGMKFAVEATLQTGAFAVGDLARRVSDMTNTHVAPSRVEALIDKTGDIRWLDQGHQWGYATATPLAPAIVEILACAAPHEVHLGEIVVGVAQWRSKKARDRGAKSCPLPTPPAGVLELMLQSRTDVRRNGMLYSLATPISPERVLSGIPLMMHAIMVDAGGSIRLKKLKTSLAAAATDSFSMAGVDTQHLWRPWIKRMSFGRYAIRGFPHATRADTPPFEQFATQWLEEKRTQLESSHIRALVPIVGDRLVPYFGIRPIGGITKAEIRGFNAALAAGTAPGQRRAQSATRTAVVSILCEILNVAAERFQFTSPVLSGIEPVSARIPDVDPFTMEEVQQIVSTVRADYKLYFLTRFFTGMRDFELLLLKWEHVNFDRRQIRVCESRVLADDEDTTAVIRERVIEMSQPVFEALTKQYEATATVSDFVLSTPQGRLMDRKRISVIWRHLLETLGYQYRVPGQIRHTAATLLLAAGKDVKWVAQHLGTTKEAVLRKYRKYVRSTSAQSQYTALDRSAPDRVAELHTSSAGEATPRSAPAIYLPAPAPVRVPVPRVDSQPRAGLPRAKVQ